MYRKTILWDITDTPNSITAVEKENVCIFHLIDYIVLNFQKVPL